MVRCPDLGSLIIDVRTAAVTIPASCGPSPIAALDRQVLAAAIGAQSPAPSGSHGSAARCARLRRARAAERSQSRRMSAARSTACERDAAPSFW
jgi:hypothetical protein